MITDQTFVLAITGPTGAGKSTVSEKLAKHFDRCVNIDADHIKHMVVSGFYFDEAHPEDPDGWGFGEWGLVGESIGMLAKNFLNHGFSVVINGYIDEPGWAKIQESINIDHKVLLLPSAEEVTRRDGGRNIDIQMGKATVLKHHAHFSTDPIFDDFIKVDTTNLSIESTIKKIVNILD